MAGQPVPSNLIKSFAKKGLLSGAGKAGSLTGLLKTAAGPLGIAASVLPAAFKMFKGIKQTNEANNINPVDPGFQMNNAVIDNARMVADRYGNYQMPGYGDAIDNVNAGFTQAFDSGSQGASSGGDVLDLATKLDYGRGRNLNQIAIQNAVGKDQMFGQVMDANAAAGNEIVQKNAYDRDQFQRELERKAALTQAGAMNTFSGGDQIAGVAGAALNYRTEPWTPNASKIKLLSSLFS